MLDGWPVLFLISGLIQMEGNPSPATLFTLDSLSIVHGIDLVFFLPSNLSISSASENLLSPPDVRPCSAVKPAWPFYICH